MPIFPFDSRRIHAALTLALVLAAGCAAGEEPETVGSGGSDPTAAGGSGGDGNQGGDAGGSGGSGGSGGDFGPCGVDCSQIDTPDCFQAVCNEGMYEGTYGTCVVVAVEDGTACEDGQFCTVSDTCVAGECTGGPANDCGMTPAECEVIVCDESGDACDTGPGPNGTPCQSPDLCINGSTCANGLCSGGFPKDCFFAPVPNECHVSVCNPQNGQCEPTPGNEGQPCTDPMDLCTINKACAAGVCAGGTPKDCSQLTQGCVLGVCDASNGMCTTMGVGNGQPCDDLDACTTGELCNNGMCNGGAPVTTCSLVGDNCCPANCTPVDDLDCQCMTSTLMTPFNSNNGLDGNMFDVVAMANIEIQGFDINIDGTCTVEIWYRPGTHVGFEMSSAGWTQAAVVPGVVSQGANVPTPVPTTVSIQIPQGQTYGLYLTCAPGSFNYTNGTMLGAVLAQNSHMQVLQGSGRTYPFGSGFAPRNFNGIIHYEQCGS
jgi:hypothetical protein